MHPRGCRRWRQRPVRPQAAAGPCTGRTQRGSLRRRFWGSWSDPSNRRISNVTAAVCRHLHPNSYKPCCDEVFSSALAFSSPVHGEFQILAHFLGFREVVTAFRFRLMPGFAALCRPLLQSKGNVQTRTQPWGSRGRWSSPVRASRGIVRRFSDRYVSALPFVPPRNTTNSDLAYRDADSLIGLINIRKITGSSVENGC